MHSVLRRVVKGVPPTDRYTTSSSGRRRRAHACHALTVSTSAPVAAAAAQVRLAVAIPLWLALYVDCLNTTASRTHMAHQQRGCTPVRDHLMLPHGNQAIMVLQACGARCVPPGWPERE